MQATPADLGMPFEDTVVPVDGLDLPAWFIPARDGAPGPGVVLVHGWESGRDRTLPMAHFLHAAGFHCLMFDVRGHGANEPEILPISGGEFGRDTLAAVDVLFGRPEVTTGAVSGHSMGAIGAILAAAADPRVEALVATSGPAGPYRLTRQTFRLANLPIPDPIAYPLAWLTTRVFLRPRGHRVSEVSSIRAIAAYQGPAVARAWGRGRGRAAPPLRAVAQGGRRGARRRSECHAGGRPRDRGRAALVAVRVRGVSPFRGPVPGRLARWPLLAGRGSGTRCRRARRAAARRR